MSYVIALLLDKESHVACQSRVQYLKQCVGQMHRKQKKLFYIPLVEIEKSHKMKLDAIKVYLDSIKGYSLNLSTAGIRVLHHDILVQLLVQDTGFKTLQRRLLKWGVNNALPMREVPKMVYIPLFKIANKQTGIHPQLWMKDQIPLQVMGTSLVLLEKEKMLHCRLLPQEPMQYVYILKCGDGSYYTGWTNDLAKRLLAHQSGKGAKYTKSHQPVQLVYVETFTNKKAAMKQEYAYKQMSHKAKAALIHKKTENP